MLPFTPSNVIFSLGSYPVGTELFFKAIAVAVFITLTSLALKKEKIFERSIDSVFFTSIVIFSMYLGGRVLYYIIEWQGPISIIHFFDITTKTGTITWGGFIGGAVAVFVYIFIKFRKKGNLSITIAKIFDTIAIPAALMIFIIRLGCFFDGHVIGKVTSVPWCVFKEGTCRHPTALSL